MDKRNTRRGMGYWIDSNLYISVTNILKVIDKPALRYWFGQQVYLAMAKDPTLSEQEALSAPYKTSDKAKSRGTTVHSIVEAYKAGTFDIDDKIVADYKGYATAFKAFISDMNARIIENEKTVFSEKYQYAGTLDLMAMLGNDKLPTIIDVKTGKDIYPEAHLQVSAYLEAIWDAKKRDPSIVSPEGAGILLLGEDGTYKYEQARDEFQAFLACKTLYESLNRNSLTKLGYNFTQIK